MLLGFLGTCIYFVGGVSATYPPIITYKYWGPTQQFENDLMNLVQSDSNMVYKKTDTVGSVESGFRMYLTIDDKGKIYDLRYEKTDDGSTLLKLVGIHSNNYTKGGYQLGDKGVSELLVNYEKDLIKKLQQRPNVKLTLMPKEFSLY